MFSVVRVNVFLVGITSDLTAGSSPSLIFLDNSDFFVMGVFCKSTWAIHLITPPPPLPGSLIAQAL